MLGNKGNFSRIQYLAGVSVDPPSRENKTLLVTLRSGAAPDGDPWHTPHSGYDSSAVPYIFPHANVFSVSLDQVEEGLNQTVHTNISTCMAPD